jgi:putative transposase
LTIGAYRAWQNGMNESVNGKFRDKFMSMEWFRNRIDTKIVIEGWRRHINESSLELEDAHAGAVQRAMSQSTPNEAVFKELTVRRKPQCQ